MTSTKEMLNASDEDRRSVGNPDAFHVHLHYQLSSGPGFENALGRPSRFSAFRRLRGTPTIPVTRGRIDTGDLVQSNR